MPDNFRPDPEKPRRNFPERDRSDRAPMITTPVDGKRLLAGLAKHPITPSTPSTFTLFDSLDQSQRVAQQIHQMLAPIADLQGQRVAAAVAGLLPVVQMHEDLNRQIAASIVPAIEAYQVNLNAMLGFDSLMREWLRPLTESLASLRDLARDIYPDNLLEADGDLDLYRQLMMEEGLPIAWVPNTETIALIVSAPTRSGRRAVYGRRWRGILNDCMSRLKEIAASEIQEHVGFAIQAVEAMRGGHPAAAQALAGSTLDTVILTYFDKETRKEIVGAKQIDLDEYGVRHYFVFAQIWGIHRSFWAERGDPVPGTFNRHGTVHGVSKRQYSRINAVLGVAHLTSVLWFLNLTYTRRK